MSTESNPQPGGQPTAQSSQAPGVSPSGTPLDKVAKAMAVAAESMRNDEANANESAGVAGVVSKTIYNTCYYLSYGVSFPTLLLISFVPKNNSICHGFVDGANAASDSVHNLREQWAAKKETATSEAGHQPTAAAAPA